MNLDALPAQCLIILIILHITVLNANQVSFYKTILVYVLKVLSYIKTPVILHALLVLSEKDNFVYLVLKDVYLVLVKVLVKYVLLVIISKIIVYVIAIITYYL